MRCNFSGGPMVAATTAVLALTLAGCGGGGGGGGSGGGSNSGGSAPNARAHMLKLSAPTGGNVTVTDRSPSGGNGANVTETSTSATFAPSGSLAGGGALSSTGALPKNAQSQTTSRIYDQSTTSTEKLIVISNEAGAVDLTSATYGMMLNASGSSAVVGGFYSGTATPTASMPTNVIATYQGGFIGSAVETGVSSAMADSVGLTGVANVSANFGSGTVSGRISNIYEDGFITSNNDIVMDGTISGNTYSGSARLVDAGTNTAVGGATRSTHTGGFYGANAGEVAGALAIEAASSGTMPRFGVGTGGVAVTGAYGGKKQ